MTVLLHPEVAAAAALVGTAVILAWMLVQQRAVLDRLEQRVAQLTGVVTLLTDTAETGLREVAAELGRFTLRTQAAEALTREEIDDRVVAASERGRSVRDIAAAEQMSEGEVRLRLAMTKARKDARHAEMR